MAEMSDEDFEALKERMVQTFAEPLSRWLKESGRIYPKETFVALATFFGHALGAAAVHHGLALTPRIATSAGELVAENMADDIAAQLFEAEVYP